MENKDKILCAIKNPPDSKNRSWLYNIFFGNITKKKNTHNHTKINFLANLSETEIQVLKERECEIIEIHKNNLKINNNNTEFKEGFMELLILFNKTMKNQTLKTKIRKLLTSKKDGRPTTQYKKIMNTKNLLSEKDKKEVEERSNE